VAQIKHRGETLVPRYEALCPGFGVEFVESVLGKLPPAFEETDKTFHACIMNKASSVVRLCGYDRTNPRCDSKCASAIKQLAPKLDGSCCAELPGGDQQRCVAQIKHRGETLVRDYEALCTGSEFVESVLGRLPLAFEETDEPTATFVETSSMSVWQAAACASVAGAVGAAAAVTIARLVGRKQEVLLAN